MRIRDWINRGVGLGLLISLLLCAAGAALGTILMSRELLAVESAGKWMAFMWLLASFVGCKFALRESRAGFLTPRCRQCFCILLYGLQRWLSVPRRTFSQTDGILRALSGAVRP